MMSLGSRLADGHPKGVSTVDDGVRQVHPTAPVGLFQDVAVHVIASGMMEADQIQWCRRRQLKVGMILDLLPEPRGKLDVVTDHRLQAIHAVMSNDEPEFQGSEATPQGHMPVPVVDD